MSSSYSDSSYEMTSLDLQRVNGVSALSSRRSRLYQIEAKYVLDTDQDTPLRVLHGRDYVSAVQMMPVFNLETHEGETEKDGSTQTTYHAGVVLALACGKIDKILRIDDSKDVIWETDSGGFVLGENGTEWNADKQYNQLTSDNGVLRIYRGTMNQITDTVLTQMSVIDDDGNVVDMLHSAYRGVAYMISDRFYLGSQNTMPNYRVECVHIPTPLEDNAAEGYVFPWGDVAFPHSTEDGDMYPPEIVYDYLTNTVWGAGLDPELIDYDSFIAAQYKCVQDGIFISSVIDEQQELEEIISQILEYCDGMLTMKNGLITLRMLSWSDTMRNRTVLTHNLTEPSTGGIEMILADPDFCTNNLTEEPTIKVDRSEINNVTVVTFNDRSASYESTSESFECALAKRNYNDEIVSESFNRPFAKCREVAAKIAKRIGFARAFPSFEITCKTIMPISNATVGDIADIGYDKLPMFVMDNKRNTLLSGRKPHTLVRIMQIQYGAPDDPVVTYVCRLHRTYNPQIEDVLNITPSIGGTIKPELSKVGGWLHPHILIEGANSIAVFNARPTSSALVNYFVDYTGENYGGTYKRIGISNQFQVPAILLSWETVSTGIRMRFVVQKKISGVNTDYMDIITTDFQNANYFYLFTSTYRKTLNSTYQTGRWMVCKSISSIEAETAANYGNYSTGSYFIFYVTVLSGELGSNAIGVKDGDTYLPSSKFFLCLPGKYFEYKNTNGVGQSLGIMTQAFFGRYGIEPGENVVATTVNLYTSFTSFSPSQCTWGSVVESASMSNVLNGSGTPTTYQEGAIYRDDLNGTVYSASSNEWSVIGQTDTGDYDSRYQLRGEVCERYYLTINASSTIIHQKGKYGVIHIIIPSSENLITVTAASAEDATLGDEILFFTTLASGVSYDTSCAISGSFQLTNGNTESSLSLHTGETLKLICTQISDIKKWIAITQSMNE